LVEKFPTVLEKLPQVLRGDFFDSHCILRKNYVSLLLLLYIIAGKLTVSLCSGETVTEQHCHL